jgi:hypothetical protein
MMRSLIILFLFLSSFCAAQTILEGRVIDAANGEPMLGVTVYISGSSTGTSTGPDGDFKISYPDDYIAPLIFSYVGYGKVTIQQPLSTDLTQVSMSQQEGKLEEVVLGLDPWSREKKEKYFKDYFLGTVPASKLCEIRNLDQVRLRFNPAYKTLYATCDVPIVVDNKLLGYTILVDMADFEVLFQEIDWRTGELVTTTESDNKNFFRPHSSFMLVSTFFKELQHKRPSQRKRKRNRKRLYDVSLDNFYKSLINMSLEEDGYKLVYKREPVEISQHIRVRDHKDKKIVEFRHLDYELLDKKGGQSIIKLESHKIWFTSNGNLLSERDILLGGFLGRLKLSGMLPLDYDPETD